MDTDIVESLLRETFPELFNAKGKTDYDGFLDRVQHTPTIGLPISLQIGTKTTTDASVFFNKQVLV